MTELQLGRRTIGVGRGVYFIAEAGSNHNGSLEQARRLIEIAARAGADAVKFQTFRAAALYPRSAGMTDYLKVPRSIYDIIRDLEMPFEWIPELAKQCAELGIDFMSTPFDELSADALEPYVPAFKIASYEMTHHALVQHCARKGKPLIVSTGTATLDEVREMVQAVRAVGQQQLAVLQCTAKYPAPLSALNLRTLPLMAREFGVLVGLSDHSREPLPGPMAATALGASIIEKHFTLSNDLPGPDHAYALEPRELADVIAAVRAVEKTLGSGEKVPQPEEAELRSFARRSVFAIRAVAAGELLTRDNTAVLRCGKLVGRLQPREHVRVLGHRARRPIVAETAISADDVGALALEEGSTRLREMRADDADAVVRWRSLPEVQSELFSAAPPTRAEHDAWFADLLRRSDRLEFVILEGDRAVGTIGLSAIDVAAKSAEYGILVGEASARRQGVARRASKALLRFAFDVLGLESVDLELFSDNTAARHLYDGLSFSEVTSGVTAAREKDGRQRAVTRMRLTRQSWNHT
jgi:N-acetylneuraminate synthase